MFVCLFVCVSFQLAMAFCLLLLFAKSLCFNKDTHTHRLTQGSLMTIIRRLLCIWSSKLGQILTLAISVAAKICCNETKAILKGDHQLGFDASRNCSGSSLNSSRQLKGSRWSLIKHLQLFLLANWLVIRIKRCILHSKTTLLFCIIMARWFSFWIKNISSLFLKNYIIFLYADIYYSSEYYAIIAKCKTTTTATTKRNCLYQISSIKLWVCDLLASPQSSIGH